MTMTQPTVPISGDIRRNVYWSIARNWGTRLGAAITFFILARILPQHELGLFAAANSVIGVSELVTENGIGDAVVQNRKGDDAHYSAAVFVNLSIAVVVALGLVVMAPHLEIWMNAPGLTPVLSVISLSILINATGYVAQAVLRRRFHFSALAIRAFVATSVSGAAGIGLALMGAGVWSMVVQLLVFALVNAIMVWWARPFRLQLASPLGARIYFRFSSRMFCNRVLDFISNRAVEIAIVAGSGTTALALWYFASRLWMLAMQLISAVTLDIGLPLFAKLADDRATLRQTYYQSVELAAALGFPVFFIMSATAPVLMTVMFGHIDPAASTILSLLSLVGAVQLIQYYNGMLINSIGRPGVTLCIMVVKAVTMAIGLYVTFGRSVEVIGITFAAITIANAPTSFFACRHYIGVEFGKVTRGLMPYLAASVAAGLTILTTRGHSVTPSPLGELVILGALGGAVYFAFIMLFFRQRGLATIRQLVGQKKGL